MGERKPNKKHKEYYVYIVDDTCHIHYYNSHVERDFPLVKNTAICHKVFMNTDAPCANCPMRKDSDRDAIYYEVTNQWMDLHCAQIDIPPIGKGYLFMTTLSHNLQLGMTKNKTNIYEMNRDGLRAFLEINELTGLPIGSTYGRQAEKFMRKRDVDYCVIAIDVANFRLFNQMYGRMAGDRLLIAIADFLKNLDKVYGTFSAYGGGDNFCALFPYDENLVTYIRDGITSIVTSFEGIEGFFPLLGGYMIRDKSRMFRDMYDMATTAMTRAMNTKGEIQWYTDQVQRVMEDELLLIPNIQEAMKNNEILVYMQPKYSISYNKVIGAEALVRWRKNDKMLSPGSFIPQLEENGFITNLDCYLWEKVCQILADWKERGLMLVPVSVNVSRKDFFTVDVPQFFTDLVHKYDIDPNLLEIEITESAFAEDENVVHQASIELRKRGFRILIDDFGSGYSTLNMLKNIQADVLKLDMKFMDFQEKSESKGEKIIRSMVSMSQALNLELIAEGVETKTQVLLLQKLHCDMVQGYYYYKPMGHEQFEELLAQGGAVSHSHVSAPAFPKKLSTNIDAEIAVFTDNLRNHNKLQDTDINQLLHALRTKTETDGAYILAPGLNPLELHFIYEDILEDKYSGIGETLVIDNERYEQLLEAGKQEDGIFSVPYGIDKQFQQPNLLQFVCLRDGVFDGAIGIETFYPKPWTQEERDMVTQVGRVLRLVVEHYRLGRLENEIQRQNTIDLLTNLHNRNAFENLIGSNLDIGDGIGIVYLDVNGLKHTNDHYGHEAGDKLLCHAAADLMQCFPYNNIYRMGGDEFLVLETNVQRNAFHQRIFHFQQLMQQDQLPRMAYGAIWNEGTMRIKELIREADSRMYADKESYYSMLKKKGVSQNN